MVGFQGGWGLRGKGRGGGGYVFWMVGGSLSTINKVMVVISFFSHCKIKGDYIYIIITKNLNP